MTDDKESLTGQEETGNLSADEGNDPFPAVPAELKERRQWVVWRDETRDGKPTKIPYQANGRKVQANNPDTWTDYQTVIKHLDRFSGIGFVFSPDDPYCGIDLDNCLDENGDVKPWAKPIVERLKTVCYAEVSPSGNGIKFWTRAMLPVEVKHKVYINEPKSEAIEAYDRGRYFTVTGKGKGTIGEGQTIVDWIVTQYLKPQPQENTSPPRSAPTHTNLNINEVISHIRASRQSAKFDALMQGNITGYGSQSEADLALCGVIAFWTQEHTVIDAIFRQSKLYNRPKWDQPHRGDKATYGQMTIEAALSGNRETYKTKSKSYSPTRRRLFRSQQLYGGRR